MSLLELLTFNKINKYFIWILSLFFFLFGFQLWKMTIFKVYIPGIAHPHKTLLFVFVIIWTIGLGIFLFLNTKSRLKLYYAFAFSFSTSLYYIWIVLWGFNLYLPLLFSWHARLIFFAFILILTGILVYFSSRYFLPISDMFSKKYVREVLILFLFFSMLFLITLDVYDTRNPALIHDYYFTDRNIFPPDYRFLVPSFIEAGKLFFQKLNFDYLADIQRLYKIYMITTLVFAYYLYYLFLTNFFKRPTALMISILLLLMFYASFIVGGLVDDPFNLLAFVIGLILIYHHKDVYLWLLIFIGSFNKETIWFLGLMYLVHNSQYINKKNWWRIIGTTFIMALTFVGVVFFRILLKPIHGKDLNWIIYNLTCEQCLFHVFLILNIFWVLAFFFREYPKQLRFFARLNLITPFFVVWHYFGLIREFRFFIVIGLILIPLGIGLLFPKSVLPKEGLEGSD